MAEAYIGEVRIFGFTFAPKGWALCNGQLLPITQNTALFSLLGVTYGGDGIQTFGVPNFADRLVVGAGAASSGTNYPLGQTGGETTVTITGPQLPAHTHTLQSAGPRYVGNFNVPSYKSSFAPGTGCTPYEPVPNPPEPPPPPFVPVAMAAPALVPVGTENPAPHNNVMAFGVVNYCIALEGMFPPHP